MGCSYRGCDGNDTLPFDCSRCGRSFCSAHRLPENHDCPGVETEETAWFPENSQPAQSSSGSRWRKLALVLLVAGLIASGVGFVAGNPGAVPTVDIGPGSETPDPPASQEPTSERSNEQGSDTEPADELDEGEVERLVHEAVNDYRAERGVDELSSDDGLAEISQYHSDNMAEDGEIYHTSPGGQTVQDRYDRFGYDCRAPAGDGRYRTSGENVAKTWYEQQLTTGEYYSTPEELADGIVRQWIDSEGHRRNLVDDVWRKEGIGVTVTEEDGNTAVYVTQNFC